MKSFDDIMNGKVNEGLAEKWEKVSDTNSSIEVMMLLDIMKKLDEIDAKLNQGFPHGDTAP